jgi:hypothetical protein
MAMTPDGNIRGDVEFYCDVNMASLPDFECKFEDAKIRSASDQNGPVPTERFETPAYKAYLSKLFDAQIEGQFGSELQYRLLSYLEEDERASEAEHQADTAEQQYWDEWR